MLSTLLLVIYLIITGSNGILLWIRNAVSSQNIVVELLINTDTNIVDITLSGPSDRWFAVGFGNTAMTNTYTITATGTNNVTERKLANHGQGTILSSTITVLSDSIDTQSTVRTITMRRNRVGDNTDYYTFPNTEDDIDIIWAFDYSGSTPWGEYHGSEAQGARGDTTLSLIETTAEPTTMQPTTSEPSNAPSKAPSVTPTTSEPSNTPSKVPSVTPTTSIPTRNPITSQPTTKSPTTTDPTTAEPTTSEPSINPTTTAPSTTPTTMVPTTSEPSMNPTTVKPSASPTTMVPTTIEPSINPITESPTDATVTTTSTVEPTTMTPTTSRPSINPTTMMPTTYKPTTASPTEQQWMDNIDRICTLDGSELRINVTINLDFLHEIIQFIVQCPLEHWCGIAFNATKMSDFPDSIIVQPIEPYATEWKLGTHNKGTKQIINTVYDISFESNTINNIYTMIRPLSNDLYTFKQTDDTIPAIYARSMKNQLIYTEGVPHQQRNQNVTYYQCKNYTQTTMISPTSYPTVSPTISYDICNNNQRCRYIISITFKILYTLLDDTGVDNAKLKAIIISTITTILNQWIPNKQNIAIQVTLSISTNAAASNGKIDINSIIGIEDDTVYTEINNAYNNDDIINDINTNLPTDINAVYTTSNFSIIYDITSTLSVINSTITTTSSETTENTEDEEKRRELWAFINFDFANYTLFDWIVVGGCILFILLGCCCLCWCINKIRLKTVPDTQMNTKTGRGRVSMFEMVTAKKQASLRPKTSLEFEYKPEQPVDPENPEAEPEPLYTSNYAATPNQNQFNAALTAAAKNDNKYHMNITAVDEDDENDVLDSHRMSTQSFGAKRSLIGNNNGGDQAVQTNLIPEEEEQEEFYDYEAEYDDNIATTSIGGGPPPVRGSMIDRMKQQENGGNNMQQKQGGPPPVRGSMLDRMKQNQNTDY